MAGVTLARVTLAVVATRLSEAIEVRPCDFAPVARILRIHRLNKRRPVEAAVAGLPEDYCRELATYIELTKPRPRDRLFPFTRFRGLRLVKGLMAKAGIEPVYRLGPKGRRADMKRHPHAWRHGFAINLIVQGKPLDVVKELLGHASILTTHIYSRALAANVRPFMETTEF
jgi:integrase